MKRINIMLGSACNWHCPYCIQDDNATDVNHKPDIDQFCRNLLQYIVNNNVEIKRVAYWGGEPALYWDYITQVQQNVFDKVKTLLPPRIISNGSLFDIQHVRWLNKTNSLVNISYHQGQLSQTQWDVCLRIKNLYVTSLVHHKCLDWEQYRSKWQYIWNKYGRCINWFVYPIKATSNVPTEWQLTKDDVDQYIDYIKSILSKAQYDPFYYRMIQILFYSFAYHEYNEQYSSYCYNDDILSVDLFGNEYFCHHDCNRNNVVGNVFNKNTNTDRKSIFLKQVNSNLTKCSHCEAYKYCLGGCFRDVTTVVTCYYTIQMLHLLQFIKQQYPDIVSNEYKSMIS